MKYLTIRQNFLTVQLGQVDFVDFYCGRVLSEVWATEFPSPCQLF